MNWLSGPRFADPVGEHAGVDDPLDPSSMISSVKSANSEAESKLAGGGEFGRSGERSDSS